MKGPLVRRVPSLLAAFLLLSLLLGCGESTGSISGEVKVKDKLLPTGLIAFQTQGKKSKIISGEIKEGKYSVASVPVGEVIVTVQVVSTKAAPAAKGAKAAPPSPTVNVPVKYADPKKSGLTFTVKSGENTYDPPLEGDGK